MKKFLIVFLLITAAVLAHGRNINGSSGYLSMPTAEALAYKEYNAGISAFIVNDDDKEPRPYSLNYWKYNLGLGWSDWMELSLSGRGEREGLFLNAKIAKPLSEADKTLLVAAGIENLSSMGTFQDYPGLYMVMTKKFVGNHSASLGFMCRSIGREMPTSMMFGVEFYANESLSLLGDFVSYNDTLPYYVSNLGLRVTTNKQRYYELALLNVGYNKEHQFTNKHQDSVTAYPLTLLLSMTIYGVLE